jgi:two-component system LytT family response regulator
MRAIIVDDSRLARTGLARMLAAFPGIELVGEADHPDTALPLIRDLDPDLLFLDIRMAGADAFDLLARLDHHPRIVFTTAHAEYAIRSFDFDTVDYLLKPVSPERLALAIRKLAPREAVPPAAPAMAPAQAPLEPDSRIFIKDGERCHMVSLASIRCFESCKNYVQVFFDNQRAYVKKSLGSVEERLPRHMFFRVSRQHIVNLNAVVRIEEAMDGGYVVTLDNGMKLDISRRNAAQLKETLSF